MMILDLLLLASETPESQELADMVSKSHSKNKNRTMTTSNQITEELMLYHSFKLNSRKPRFQLLANWGKLAEVMQHSVQLCWFKSKRMRKMKTTKENPPFRINSYQTKTKMNNLLSSVKTNDMMQVRFKEVIPNIVQVKLLLTANCLWKNKYPMKQKSMLKKKLWI